MRANLAVLALVAGCRAAHASEPSQDDFTTRVRIRDESERAVLRAFLADKP